MAVTPHDAWVFARSAWHGFLFWTGASNPSDEQYGWWSGFFGDVTVFAAVVMYVRHRNCHVKGCWRTGKATLHDGSPYTVCHHHHPDHENGTRLTAERVLHLHRRHHAREGERGL